MPYRIVKGDLLEAKTEYIVQQNCCTAVRAHGLSKAIATKWPEINPYKDRKVYKNNWCVAEDRPEPGSIHVYEFEESDSLKGVICAFAQVSHSKPGTYDDPLGLVKNDSAKDRKQYFAECLEGILELKPKSVGFPYKIGCGLAGGHWPSYEKIIKDWSEKNPSIDVVVYQIDR